MRAPRGGQVQFEIGPFGFQKKQTLPASLNWLSALLEPRGEAGRGSHLSRAGCDARASHQQQRENQREYVNEGGRQPLFLHTDTVKHNTTAPSQHREGPHAVGYVSARAMDSRAEAGSLHAGLVGTDPAVSFVASLRTRVLWPTRRPPHHGLVREIPGADCTSVH